MRALVIGLTLLAAATGCATIPRDTGIDEVRSQVQQRGDYPVNWRSGREAERAIDAAVAQRLARELTARDAVEVALLNNRRLQATYARLGLSQARVVEAGLFRNPRFSVQARFPDGPPSATNLEFDAAMDLLDMLLLPLRLELAEAQFARTRLTVADEVLKTAAEARTAYYDVLAAQQAAAMRRAAMEAAQASHELAMRMEQAGNITELELALEQAAFEQARVQAAEAEGAVAAAREVLNRLMGVWGEQTTWRTVASLPAVPAADPALERLESLAVEHRLDIAAAKTEAQIVAATLGITRDYGWLTALEIGGSGERDTDRQWVAGPRISVELPIFNRGQARAAAAEAQLREAEMNLAALAIEARSAVRAARDRLTLARQVAEHYRSTLIPLRERIVQLSLQRYNFMLSGIAATLGAKQQEYQAYERYIRAVRDYWVARSDLERAVGASLSDETPTRPAVAAPRPSDTPHPHKH